MELPFSKLLDANGLKLSDFKIVNINPSATPAALASGNVDATFLLSDGLLLEQKGDRPCDLVDQGGAGRTKRMPAPSSVDRGSDTVKDNPEA